MDIMTYMFDEENNKRLFGLDQRRLGKREGKREEKKRTAIELLNIDMDISMIEQITGLSKTEILKLKHTK